MSDEKKNEKLCFILFHRKDNKIDYFNQHIFTIPS